MNPVVPIPPSRRPGRDRLAGFTLVEMMIAIMLGLVIMSTLVTFFVQSNANRSEMERGSRQIENGRYAMGALREDIALAGYYYDVTQTGVAWQQPAACTTAVADLGFSNSPLKLPIPIFGYADGVGVPGCVSNLVAGTDVLVIRRFNTEPTPVASADPAQAYVQVSHCKTDTTSAPLVAGAGSSPSTFILREVVCGAPAKLWRHRENVYYIRNFSTIAGDGVSTLVRLELDGGATRIVPLVEGIQSMHFEYGLDTNSDGAPDSWRRCDTATPCTLAEWATVTGIRAYLLSASTEDSPGYTDTKTYDMGLAGVAGPFTSTTRDTPSTVSLDNTFKKRHLYKAVVNATNRSGLRERS